MKMTSKGMLLLTLAGVVGAGCSAPADGDGPDPKPTANPPYFGMPQQQVQMQTPAPSNMPPVGAAMGAAGSSSVAMGAAGSAGVAMGAAGAGGTGGMATAGAIPVGAPGTGFVLTPVAGWVAGGTNEAGIQGSFFPLSDANNEAPQMPGTTTITPAEDFSMAMGAPICVSGTASQVIGEAYGQYWGGGVGFNLSDPGGMTGPTPWARGRVVGFSFDITGNTIPPAGQFRFGADFYEGAAINGDSCISIAAGANTIMLGQIVNACWDGGAMAPPLSATAMLQSLKWQVATATAAPTPFNFCIENLRAIVQ
ncbi:MAG: hypothetical protein RL685_6976 [Pseudomonadota bacterium]